ncbi:MAG: LamG domain-containing protein, partial [Minisyncoccia bacterium]
IYIGTVALSNDPTSAPAGWTELVNTTGGTSGGTGAIYYKIADGGEGATVNVTSSSGSLSSHNTYRISGVTGTPEATSAGGSSNNPDPPSLTPSWGAGDTLWIAMAGAGVQNATTPNVTAYPSSYADGIEISHNFAAFAGFSAGSARRSLNATSDDPGTFTINGTSPQWIASTLAIEGVEDPVAPPVTLSKPPNNLGIVGYWSFDDATSTRATDFSGRGNHGTLGGSPPATWVSGKRGAALSFDNSDDNVNMGTTPASLNLTGDLTISAWIKPTSLGGGSAGRIVDNGTGSVNGYIFRLGSSNNLAFEGSTGSPASNASSITLGVWQHVAVSFSGTTATFYVNGVAAGSGSTDPATATSLEFIIGARPAATDRQFDGLIDEVRVYGRALGPTELVTLAKSGAVKFTSSSVELQRGSTLASGLVGHWTFDGKDTTWASETTGTTRDMSGNNNTGTMTNMSRDAAQAQGMLGQAFNIDGNDDYLSCSSSGFSTGNANWSASTWFYMNAGGTNQGFFSWGDFTDSQLVNIAVTSAGKFTIGHFNNDWTSTVDAPVRQWSHLTVTYNGTTETVYLNGVPVASNDPTTLDITLVGCYLGNLVFGAFNQPFNGKLDDMRVYNRELSATEIKKLFNLGKATIRP